MAITPLTDAYGRSIGDVRISVTDRCNFRCTYCIVGDEVSWLPSSTLLTCGEIVRLASTFARFGVRKLRLTGGEPLLRRDLIDIIRSIKALGVFDDIALTTNGRLFAPMAAALREAGVSRVNISLDSLKRERFVEMTRRDALPDVLAAIEAAAEHGFNPVKINAVIIRGVNDDEIVDFARMAMESGHTERFIEFMPLDSGHRWSRDQVVPGAEIVETIRSAFELVPIGSTNRSETAKRYAFAGGRGEIGVISPVTNPFCGNCNRLRLTADGQLRTCLFSVREHDLRAPLREGANDEELAAVICAAVLGKEAGHRIGQDDFVAASRTMSCIGG